MDNAPALLASALTEAEKAKTKWMAIYASSASAAAKVTASAVARQKAAEAATKASKAAYRAASAVDNVREAFAYAKAALDHYLDVVEEAESASLAADAAARAVPTLGADGG